MPRQRTSPLVTIGYVELVDLPEWQVFRLPVKVDTGALSSALHVDNLCRWEDDWLTFDVPLEAERARTRNVEARLVRVSQVRSTSGRVEERPFVRTRLWLGPLEIEIEIGLVDRSGMNYAMLLGRAALAGQCLVDPARCYLL